MLAYVLHLVQAFLLKAGVAHRQHFIDQQNLRFQMRRYGEGVGNYLDALSVQQQLLLAERQLAELEARRIDLSVQLIRALGGGFEPDAAAVAQASATGAH